MHIYYRRRDQALKGESEKVNIHVSLIVEACRTLKNMKEGTSDLIHNVNKAYIMIQIQIKNMYKGIMARYGTMANKDNLHTYFSKNV